MKIAITRLENKAAGDRALCAAYGHDCYTVSPLRAELREERIDAFIEAVHRGEFDCLFFASALPAALIAPRLERWPRVIAIGPKTAEVLRGSGIDAEVLPSFYSRAFAPYLGDWLRGRTFGRSGSTPSSPREPNSRLRMPTPSSLQAPCLIGRRGGSPVTAFSSSPSARPPRMRCGQADTLRRLSGTGRSQGRLKP